QWVNGRHFTLSHSLVSARCTPTSIAEFSARRRAASGNHGDGAITSIEVSMPSRWHLINASLPLWENPMSSPRTISRMVFESPELAASVEEVDKPSAPRVAPTAESLRNSRRGRDGVFMATERWRFGFFDLAGVAASVSEWVTNHSLTLAATTIGKTQRSHCVWFDRMPR